MPIPSGYSGGPFGSGGNVKPTHPAFEQYRKLKEAQSASMQEHQAFSQQLEVKQQQVQQRQGDLDITGRLFKILDSRIPKPARQFLSRELAQRVGVDPKSEQFKNVSTMITSLDPDSLQAIKSSVAAQMSGASPGQIQEQIQAIFSGKADGSALIDQISQHMAAGGGQDQLGGGEKQDRLPQGAEEPEPAVARPSAPGGGGTIQSFEGTRTVPAGADQASSTLVGALGLDSKTRFRTNDLIQQGFRIPFDAKEQDKLATEINTRATGISTTIAEATKIVSLFEGKPEVLGPGGQIIRGVQATVRQVEGLINFVRPDIQNGADANDPYTLGLARRIGERLAKTHGKLDQTAMDSAKIQSSVMGLAYRMAIAQNIPGNRLTNAIINQNLQIIGQSSSPEQFKAVLGETMTSITREFDETIKRQVGVSGIDIVTRQLKDNDIAQMTEHADMLPEDFSRSLLNEAIKRKAGTTTGPAAQRQSPTLEEEEQTLGTLETQKKTRELERGDQTQTLELQREGRAARTEERQNEREDRMAEAQAANAQLQREQFEASKTERATDNAFQREQFDYRKSQDIKQEDKERSDKIGAAFRSFGAAIANSRSGIGSLSVPSLGGGQDVNAFRMNPPPQRTPPRPGGR